MSLERVHSGKTRETFNTLDSRFLLVEATNRLSTHNIVHESRIPKKGEVLTALTVYWLKMIEGSGIRHHLVAFGKDIYKYLTEGDYDEDLHLRAVVIEKLKMIPVEFIFRSYLTGSLYSKFYSKGLGNPYGVALTAGLHEMCEFPHPIFTPTDKSETDEPLDSRETKENHREAYLLAQKTYITIQSVMRRVGLEMVDSKFELGFNESGQVVLADEVCTPDSSRFCLLSEIKEGYAPPWLDKQLAREEAERIWNEMGGNKGPISFSEEITQKISQTYLDVFSKITGQSLEDWQKGSLF